MKIDKEIDSDESSKDEPSVTVENPVRGHGGDSMGFKGNIAL